MNADAMAGGQPMQADETRLRRQLAATAAGASAPRFSARDVAVRVRRLRRRRAGIAGAAAAAAAAAAVAIPLGLGGMAPDLPRSSPPPALGPLPAWSVTANGQTAVGPGRVDRPQFHVTKGERVTITMTIAAPAHGQITKFFLGITGNTAGIDPGGRPIGMSPVLATAGRLGPGTHVFTVRWTVPRGSQPIFGYQLVVYGAWRTHNESVDGEFPLVTFVAS